GDCWESSVVLAPRSIARARRVTCTPCVRRLVVSPHTCDWFGSFPDAVISGVSELLVSGHSHRTLRRGSGHAFGPCFTRRSSPRIALFLPSPRCPRSGPIFPPDLSC